MLTVIPYFREIIISAFECPECGFRNNGILSAAQNCERGVSFEVFVKDKKDLLRQIVKSEFASVRFPGIDLELPRKSGAAYLTTVEGLLDRVLADMKKALQDSSITADPNAKLRIENIVSELENYSSGNTQFSFILDDITGNSFVENFHAPRVDPHVKELNYRQDPSILAELGFATVPEVDDEPEAENVHCFNTKCPECLRPCKTKMTMVDIPYFKEVLLMATSCDECGYKTNEVKTGGAISALGRRITLVLKNLDDLSRDILKSETCHLRIPEIDLELQTGTLGGRFTTVEGLLRQVYRELEERVSFSSGDSAPEEKKIIFASLLEKIISICEGRLHCTMILEDPLANSYIQNLYAPDPDPGLTIEDFSRTLDQEEDLGIADMKTENYEL